MSTQRGNTSRVGTVIERTFRTRVETLWRLWTTKEGFESWWAPDGCRVEVHTIEAREGGTLHYNMIAIAPAQIAEVKQLGLATSNSVRARFKEFKPHQRLMLTSVIDFVPGVEHYESMIAVDFFLAGDTVRMVTTLAPMHADEFTEKAIMVLHRPAQEAGGAITEAVRGNVTARRLTTCGPAPVWLQPTRSCSCCQITGNPK